MPLALDLGMSIATSERIVPFATLVGLLGILVLPLMSMRSAPARPTACDCPTVQLDDAFCRSDLVFEGIPVKMDTVFVRGGMKNSSDNTMDHVAVRFQVERVLKGSATMIVDVATTLDHDACGFYFIPGQHYLVFTSQENGMLKTDRCTPTRNLDTVTRRFTDSLSYVMSGHQWEGRVPMDVPCR